MLFVTTVYSGHVEFVLLPRTLSARPENAIVMANMMSQRSPVVFWAEFGERDETDLHLCRTYDLMKQHNNKVRACKTQQP